MIFDQDEGVVCEGLISYPDYAYAVQQAQLIPLADRDYLQASSDPSEEVGGSVNG